MWRPPRELRTLPKDTEVRRLIGLLRKGDHDAARTLAAYPIEYCSDIASICSAIAKAAEWPDRLQLLEKFASRGLASGTPRSLCIIANALARHKVGLDMMHEVLGRLPLVECNGQDLQMLAVYVGVFPRECDSANFWERMVTVPLDTMSPIGLATLVQAAARTRRALPRWKPNASYISLLKDRALAHLGAMAPRHLCSLMGDLLFLQVLDAASAELIEREARRQQKCFQPRDVVQFAKCCAKLPKSMRRATPPIPPYLFSRCSPLDFTEVLRLWATAGWSNIALSGELLNRWQQGFCLALPKLSSERLAFVAKDIAKRGNAPRIVSALLEPTLQKVDVHQLSLGGVVAACRGARALSGNQMAYRLEQRALSLLGPEVAPHLLCDSVNAFTDLSHTPPGLIAAVVRSAAAMANAFGPQQIAHLASSLERIQVRLPQSVVQKAASILHTEPKSWNPHDLVTLVASTDDKRIVEKAEKVMLRGPVPQRMVGALATAFGLHKVWKRVRPQVLEFHTLRVLAELNLDEEQINTLRSHMTEKATLATFDDAAAVAHVWAQRERRDEELFTALEPVLRTGLCYKAFYALAKLGVAPAAQRAMTEQLRTCDVRALSDADSVRISVALCSQPLEAKEILQTFCAHVVSRKLVGWQKSIQFAGAVARHLFRIDDALLPIVCSPRKAHHYVLDGVQKDVAGCLDAPEQYFHPPFHLRLCIADAVVEVLSADDYFDTHLKPFTFLRLRCLAAMGYKVAVIEANCWPAERHAQRTMVRDALEAATTSFSS